MVTTENPYKSWQEYLEEQAKKQQEQTYPEDEDTNTRI